MSTLKTPLYDCHVSLNASMIVFANTWLPLRFESEKAEHMAVRSAIGLFDVSHMGEIFIEGEEASAFLQKVLTRKISAMKPFKALYALMLNERGGIIDDLIVYRLLEHRFMLCVNAANIERDFQWLSEQAQAFKVSVWNLSSRYAQIALQGPKAINFLETLLAPVPKRFYCQWTHIKDIPCLVARTGYTGEDGVEIFVLAEHAAPLWNLLLDHGAPFGIKACGLAARDSLRLEARLLLHGSDINEQTSPLEAGLSFAIDKDHPDFIGYEALKAYELAGLKKLLVSFILKERGLARQGYRVLNNEREPIGTVCSGSWPETKEFAIGLAYLKMPAPKSGSEVYIEIRDKLIKAVIEYE